jgi:CubicO group peptidase (beta-lactamase class C family)
MHRLTAIAALALAAAPAAFVRADEPKAAKPAVSDYFPPPESKGGWRSLLPEKGDPTDEQKAAIAKTGGVDWDKLKEAWEFNTQAEGGTGLLVIRHGYVVGEWYRDGDKERTFNIYSSSKAYTSLAYGLILADWEGDRSAVPAPGSPAAKKLTLDTKVCNAEWLPESLPLPDERKADITVRNLLNMASGLGEDNVPEDATAFEWALGHIEKSPLDPTKDNPFLKLKADPGKEFHYSNAGVAHLVLLFQHATGRDLMPFLKDRIFDPIGMNNVTWKEIGGGKIGPLSQGYSGVMTTPREHARFLWLALHKGEWAGKRLAPADYYDFAWKGQDIKPEYGGQWWVYPRHKDSPKDLVQTAGALNNHGYVVPSLDLVFVRLGNGKKFPKGDFEDQLVMKVLAAVNKE